MMFLLFFARMTQTQSYSGDCVLRVLLLAYSFIFILILIVLFLCDRIKSVWSATERITTFCKKYLTNDHVSQNWVIIFAAFYGKCLPATN